MAWEPDPDDEIVEMARLAGVPAEELSRWIGHGWYRAGLRDLVSDLPDRWFAAGDPPQVLLRILPYRLEVAGARIHWNGQTPELQPVHAVGRPRDGNLDEELEWLAVQLLDAGKRSQRRFTFCRFCRTVCAPEHLFQAKPPVCHGCGSRYFDVVY